MLIFSAALSALLSDTAADNDDLMSLSRLSGITVSGPSFACSFRIASRADVSEDLASASFSPATLDAAAGAAMRSPSRSLTVRSSPEFIPSLPSLPLVLLVPLVVGETIWRPVAASAPAAVPRAFWACCMMSA